MLLAGLDLLPENTVFDGSNALEWIVPDKFNDYLIHKSRITAQNAPKLDADVIEISDDEPTPSPPRLVGPEITDMKPILLDIINLCDSESDTETPPSRIKLEAKPQPAAASQHKPGRFRKVNGLELIKISRSQNVHHVVQLNQIPVRWPAAEPDSDTAFVLDFSSDDRAKKQTRAGKPKGLDALLKVEDQDSWGKGSNGMAGYKCEYFDDELLAGYERTDGEDMSLTREIFTCELVQNETDSGSPAAKAASFYRVVQRLKPAAAPRPDATESQLSRSVEMVPALPRPMLRPRRLGSARWTQGAARCMSADIITADSVATPRLSAPHGGAARQAEPRKGLNAVNGCRGKNRLIPTLAIPADVDETILASYLDGSVIPPPEPEAHSNPEGLYGKVVTGKMVKHACSATKIVYTSKDPNVQKCVVIFRGRHSHPPWPLEKTVNAAKEDVKKSLSLSGTLGETGGHLNTSTATRALLGSSINVKHPAFRDKRCLRDEVSRLKSDATPAGLVWAGIVEDYLIDQKLPKEQRYIHQIRMDGAIKIAVTMVPELAALLHGDGVSYLEGEMNEWEAAIWYTPTFERVTIARIYANSCTKEAFTHLFDAFFSVVKEVTGKPVRFKAFHPKGNLYSIHFDMEAAQVQGLGVSLAKMVSDDPALRQLFPSIDPDVLVQFIVKLCSVHSKGISGLSNYAAAIFIFSRSTDVLVAVVGQKTVDYLNRFRGLSKPEDISNWHQFCKTHENKKLRDWYAHKISYPWLLPGYNESLSRFPTGFWQHTPSHTNLVESAHVATNRATTINLLPVEAVRTARKYDFEKAASIAAALDSCIMVNRNNHDQSRMRRTATCATKRQSYRQEHDEIGDSITDV
ncbi:hypothetical protein B0H14DRAFT_3448547 [Mycena olivaceomarginata]|nr:hypothetical protein B0H14DRAFT_3448547 [Mycena olivaceomarginata]